MIDIIMKFFKPKPTKKPELDYNPEQRAIDRKLADLVMAKKEPRKPMAVRNSTGDGVVDEAGRYSDECNRAFEDSGAETTLLIILRGRLGSGFSVCTKYQKSIERIPTILRGIADDIEKDQHD